jgi:hypothetical protein
LFFWNALFDVVPLYSAVYAPPAFQTLFFWNAHCDPIFTVT